MIGVKRVVEQKNIGKIAFIGMARILGHIFARIPCHRPFYTGGRIFPSALLPWLATQRKNSSSASR